MPSKSRTSLTSCCAVSRDRCPSPPIIAHPPRVIALYRYRLPFGNAYPESPVSVAADSILCLIQTRVKKTRDKTSDPLCLRCEGDMSAVCECRVLHVFVPAKECGRAARVRHERARLIIIPS